MKDCFTWVLQDKLVYHICNFIWISIRILCSPVIYASADVKPSGMSVLVWILASDRFRVWVASQVCEKRFWQTWVSLLSESWIPLICTSNTLCYFIIVFSDIVFKSLIFFWGVLFSVKFCFTFCFNFFYLVAHDYY